jgi:hypothetical protein
MGGPRSNVISVYALGQPEVGTGAPAQRLAPEAGRGEQDGYVFWHTSVAGASAQTSDKRMSTHPR